MNKQENCVSFFKTKNKFISFLKYHGYQAFVRNSCKLAKSIPRQWWEWFIWIHSGLPYWRNPISLWLVVPEIVSPQQLINQQEMLLTCILSHWNGNCSVQRQANIVSMSACLLLSILGVRGGSDVYNLRVCVTYAYLLLEQASYTEPGMNWERVE